MIVWIGDKLSAWGRWVQTNRGMGSKGLSASWSGVGGGNYREAFIPVRSIEASRTDDWVQALPDEFDRKILMVVYCTPLTATEQAKQLKVSLRTLYKRLHALHVRYAIDLGMKKQASEDQKMQRNAAK